MPYDIKLSIETLCEHDNVALIMSTKATVQNKHTVFRHHKCNVTYVKAAGTSMSNLAPVQTTRDRSQYKNVVLPG